MGTRAYDALEAPDPEAWQSLDELERVDLVKAYHEEIGVDPPNEDLHAMIHVGVENQIALGDEIPVRLTLERLMRDGLDRHDAIHAIGSVLAAHLHELMSGEDVGADPNAKYFEELSELTAAKWREEFG